MGSETSRPGSSHAVTEGAGDELYAVFSASGRPGLAQVRQLHLAGRRVRAITRQAHPHPTLQECEIVAADLNDPPSVHRACTDVDVVMYTAPTFAERSKGVEHLALVASAARDAGVRRVVYNTTSWYPDEPIGVPSMDRGVAMSAALRDSGVGHTIVRPSLFMDNLLTRWVKPALVEEGVFAYPHDDQLEVSWINLDDVASYMIAVADRADYDGITIDVGGPEALRPTEVASILGELLGRPIEYRRLTPREFGERMYDIFAPTTDLDRETYVSQLEKHYQFKNTANPFKVQPTESVARLGVRPRSLREWGGAQDWSLTDQGVGSISG